METIVKSNIINEENFLLDYLLFCFQNIMAATIQSGFVKIKMLHQKFLIILFKSIVHSDNRP